MPGPAIDHHIVPKSDYEYIMYKAKKRMLYITQIIGEIYVPFDVYTNKN